ncbi:Uncharacterised protein [[Clostridium] sordellii]|nr:Uncharacterised protein [[Clostridium] sordellii] [Paeniclostridium sordellii]CEN96907.1 Uncharacterised protein [[Clostridium] sordellii] [Paeniclostridium sordellii]CEP42725.1 Uncharacterised protein [[Clostridium] sordellii] [Paeniclostridium sordellii]
MLFLFCVATVVLSAYFYAYSEEGQIANYEMLDRFF